MGQHVAQTVKKGHLNACVASDPKQRKHLLQHYEGCASIMTKLMFALHMYIGKTGNRMTANETHSIASTEKSGSDYGWVEGSTGANNIVC